MLMTKNIIKIHISILILIVLSTIITFVAVGCESVGTDNSNRYGLSKNGDNSSDSPHNTNEDLFLGNHNANQSDGSNSGERDGGSSDNNSDLITSPSSDNANQNSNDGNYGSGEDCQGEQNSGEEDLSEQNSDVVSPEDGGAEENLSDQDPEDGSAEPPKSDSTNKNTDTDDTSINTDAVFSYEHFGDKIIINGLKSDVTSLTVPSIYDGFEVYSVKAFAIYNRPITDIFIEDGIILCTDSIVRCTDLIKFSARGCSLEYCAITACDNLYEINVSGSELAEGSLQGCTTVKMLCYDGQQALSHVFSYDMPCGMTVTITDGISSINSNIYHSSVERIILPDSIVSVDTEGITALTSLNSWSGGGSSVYTSNGVLYASDTLCSYPMNAMDEEFHLPSNIMRVGSYAFYNCRLLRIYLTDVAYIGEYAFSCSALQEVTITGEITTLNEGLFKYCRSLSRVILPSIYEMKTYVFFNTALYNITLPPTLALIGKYCFANTLLKEIDLPDSMQKAERLSFDGAPLQILYCSQNFDWAYAFTGYNNKVNMPAGMQVILR